MDTSAAVGTLAQYLKKKKLRPTRERFMLVGEIMATDGHFDADELYSSLVAKGLKISRATVYNTLDLLVDCGRTATARRMTAGVAAAPGAAPS